MSADNWTVCPACRKRVNAENEERTQKARDSYGVVSATEYERLAKEAKMPIPQDDTLREDYEIGIWKGKFEVSYKACCTECGWQHTFTHSKPI